MLTKEYVYGIVYQLNGNICLGFFDREKGNGPVLPLLEKFAAKRDTRASVHGLRSREHHMLSCEAAKHMGLVKYHLHLTLSTPLPVMRDHQEGTVNLIGECKDVFSSLATLRGVKVK